MKRKYWSYSELTIQNSFKIIGCEGLLNTHVQIIHKTVLFQCQSLEIYRINDIFDFLTSKYGF